MQAIVNIIVLSNAWTSNNIHSNSSGKQHVRGMVVDMLWLPGIHLLL